MNSIDKHYYSSFEQILRPFYDWEGGIINVGCNNSEINIANTDSRPSNDALVHTSHLIHEYIHYLQNFSTAWGAPVFIDFAISIMKIGASSTEVKETLTLPLIRSDLKNTLLIDGINLRDDVLSRIASSDHFEFHESGTLIGLNEINPNVDSIWLTNGRVTASLGNKVIREHMAHMGTQLYLQKSDSEIHRYNESTRGFIKEEVPFSMQSEYWIVFEYLYQLGKYTNLGKGIFHLMQQCLVTLNPGKCLLRFFNWVNSTNISHQDFTQVVEEWLRNANEIYYLHAGLTKSVSHCERMIELTERHKEKHDLFTFANKMSKFALNNIKNTTGGRFLFRPDDDFTDILFWKRLMTQYGTGLVRYLDGTMIHGSTTHCHQMQDCFTYLISCSLVLKKILKNQIPNCPFMDDIPICEAKFKGLTNCFVNPFLVDQEEDGKSCLFRGGVELLGLQSRIAFN